MADARAQSQGPVPFDPYSVGWWIEAADEEVYGPASRETVQRLATEGVMSANTLVRHVTQAEAKPLADQPALMEGLSLGATAAPVGDRLGKVWPRKWREQQALAEGTVPCVWHKRPAVSYCLRCQAPYCQKCRMKPYKTRFYYCRHCQANNHNRRFVAFMIDVLVFIYVPAFLAVFLLTVFQVPASEAAVPLVQLAGAAVFLVRDSLFGGAGPGKRVMGLRVVQLKDGTSPLTYGQGVLRWLSQYIPIFNLFDAFAPLRDPLQRRYGDRWAGTRVIDTPSSLAKARTKVQARLAKKGIMVLLEAEAVPEARSGGG
jgi:uncharacterized RDD family membrane protein YckC